MGRFTKTGKSLQSVRLPPALATPKKNWTSTEYSIQLGSEVYSLREGQGRRRTLDLILSIPPSLPPITQERKTMKTHFPRERGIERERACARARRRRQAKHFGVPQSEFGGGHSNNDSIHSFTPIHLPTTVPTLFLYILPLSTSTDTVYTFRGKPTNHAPSLAHNHSTFMEMCVIAVRYTTR